MMDGWVVLGGGVAMEDDRELGALRMGAIDVMEAIGVGMELPIGKMGTWERDAVILLGIERNMLKQWG